jgi:hypothetical protein
MDGAYRVFNFGEIIGAEERLQKVRLSSPHVWHGRFYHSNDCGHYRIGRQIWAIIRVGILRY